MPIEKAAPPFGHKVPHNYNEFLRCLKEAPGEWFSLPIEEIVGLTPKNKQINIHSSAKAAKLLIQTTIQDGRLYARTKPVAPPFAPSRPYPTIRPLR